MSKKSMLEKHIKDMQERIAQLRESNQPKSVGLARLIESEVDKAEAVINARAIASKIQSMAEGIVNLQGKQLFDMLEGMKESYGPDVAEQFKTSVQGALNTLMGQISAAKDVVDNQVLRMEKIINGEPADDMSMDMGAEDTTGGLEDPMGGGDDAGAFGGGEEAPQDGELGGEAPDMGGDEPAPDMGGDLDAALGDLGAPDDSNAAGRARKESFLSDKKVLEAFRRSVKEGHKPSAAARLVAEKFAIDTDDVRDIVKEAAKA